MKDGKNNGKTTYSSIFERNIEADVKLIQQQSFEHAQNVRIKCKKEILRLTFKTAICGIMIFYIVHLLGY